MRFAFIAILSIFAFSVSAQETEEMSLTRISAKGATEQDCPSLWNMSELDQSVEAQAASYDKANNAHDNNLQGYAKLKRLLKTTSIRLDLKGALEGQSVRKTIVSLSYTNTDHFPDGVSDLVDRWECRYVVD